MSKLKRYVANGGDSIIGNTKIIIVNGAGQYKVENIVVQYTRDKGQ